MPEIKRIELERDNDLGVHEVKEGERLEPVEPAPEKGPEKAPKKQESGKPEAEKEEFERATTPFPSG